MRERKEESGKDVCERERERNRREEGKEIRKKREGKR